MRAYAGYWQLHEDGVVEGSVSMTLNHGAGLENVASFETEIAEIDSVAGALRYRGVDVEDLVGSVTFGNVWALLVDGRFGAGLPPAEPFPVPVHTGDVRVDVQAALAMLSPIWNYRPLSETSVDEVREQLARASVMALSYVAQSARGIGRPAIPQARIDLSRTVVERFMTRWRGEPDPDHVNAVDAYFVATADDGTSASTLTARMIASTGADVAAALSGAIGAMSGPLHGGAPAQVLPVLAKAELCGDATKVVAEILDRHDEVPGFGRCPYQDEDPRARVLRRTCQRLGVPRTEAAMALERATLSLSRERFPDRTLGTKAEFWAAVLLDFAEVPPYMASSMFTCARIAGWCAHIMEQKRSLSLVPPSARYVGVPPRKPADVEGWKDIAPALLPATDVSR